MLLPRPGAVFGAAGHHLVSLDASIATVSPSMGPETTVTGVRFGKTRVRALITGVAVEAFAVVCDGGQCPPPPF